MDEWVEFDDSPEHGQRLPYERRDVLVQIAPDDKLGMPPSVAVGYLRFASDSVSPYFVVPGFGRRFIVTHWNDCLGDEFKAPLWECKQTIPPPPTIRCLGCGSGEDLDADGYCADCNDEHAEDNGE